jgi:hypothetical protein
MTATALPAIEIFKAIVRLLPLQDDIRPHLNETVEEATWNFGSGFFSLWLITFQLV